MKFVQQRSTRPRNDHSIDKIGSSANDHTFFAVNAVLVNVYLLMAVWRRKPTGKVLVHSDQGSQYTSHDWSEFLIAHGLEGSMSRRGNYHDNAVAESFFQLLKRERIKRKIYSTREAAKSDIFNVL